MMFPACVPQADIAVLVVPAAEELEQEKDAQLMALMRLKFESEAPHFLFSGWTISTTRFILGFPSWVSEDFNPALSWILIP